MAAVDHRAHDQAWDPASPEHAKDPNAAMNRMRASCPVAFSEQFGGFWALFRREDIASAARNTEAFSSVPAVTIPPFSVADAPWVPLQADPPEHRQYRRIINPMFLASRLESFRPQLVQLTHQFINEFIADGRTDLVESLSFRLPATAITMLLGLPVDFWQQLRDWLWAILQGGNTGDFEAIVKTYTDMYAFSDKWMEERRESPADDVMSVLVSAEIDGRPLTVSEIRGAVALLIAAGYETTSDTITNVLVLLDQRRDLRSGVRRQIEEGGAIQPAALEELIRYGCPVQGMARTTTRDVEVGGQVIPAGSPVALMFGSANRDPDAFADPDEVDLERSPNPHMTFGWGTHRCMGEQLARMEIEIVIQAVMQRMPDYELDGETEPSFWPSIGLHKYPVRFTPGPVIDVAVPL